MISTVTEQTNSSMIGINEFTANFKLDIHKHIFHDFYQITLYSEIV
jgi:hypothetical protein